MEDIYVDIRNANDWIKKYFNSDFVSVDQLISCIEDLDSEVEVLKEQIEEYEKTEEERYENYLSNKADNYNDDKKLGLL